MGANIQVRQPQTSNCYQTLLEGDAQDDKATFGFVRAFINHIFVSRTPIARPAG
jgi:hypothetical protein